MCTGSISNKPFEIIFSDVWTSPIMPSDGYKYLVSFIDDYSRFVWIFPLVLKSEVYQVFMQFRQWVKVQFQYDIKALHSDWGDE